ncbi:DUF1109 family protein [Sphingosinicellaceae bacterium]|nr:DUF1109 family protein [Sphingosinicellaceae bacterium]
MPTERLIDGLVAGLTPVRRRAPWRDVALLALVAAAELVLVTTSMPMRHDMGPAMHRMMFWWKLGGSLCITVASVAALVVLLTPDARPNAGRRRILGAAAAVLAGGVALVAAGAMPMGASPMAEWREGFACMACIVLFGIPLLAAMVFVARRAAPARPRAAATAAGLAAAGWGAVVFAWSCPHDDPGYVAVWFGLALAGGALAGRLLLPRLLRW